jgi:hypothetical protein
MDDFTSREERKSESIKRMQQLGLEAAVIDDLILRDKIVCSDYGMFKDVPEEIKKKIEDWEKKYHNFVYHVIHSNLYGFEIYDCLSVSCYRSDWDYENDCINYRHSPMSYSINVTKPEYTESGLIVVAVRKGVLKRLV